MLHFNCSICCEHASECVQLTHCWSCRRAFDLFAGTVRRCAKLACLCYRCVLSCCIFHDGLASSLLTVHEEPDFDVHVLFQVRAARNSQACARCPALK